MQRHLMLEGSYNVRDVGGYTTEDGATIRWGRLFRADSLHRLSPQAVEILRQRGLRTIIDLRRPEEKEAAPNLLAGQPGIAYHHISLIGDRDPNTAPAHSLPEIYRRILDHSQEQIAQILTILAQEEGTPALVHCTAGKDRTGIIVALLLTLSGVPQPQVVEDYALSSHYLGESFVKESQLRAAEAKVDWDLYQRFLTCPPEYMQETLDYLTHRYGGVHRYLTAIGIDEARQTALRCALLETL
jgi:protein-tyrosine phosphatase